MVVGAGAAARDAARFLTDASWQVTRLPILPQEAVARQLAGASVVIFEMLTGFESPAVLPELGAETATVALTEPEAPWPRFDGLGPHRPRLVPLPVSREALFGALDAALVYRRLLTENRLLRKELRAAVRLDDFVGCSAEAASVRGAITTAAFAEAPVLVLGESGSGRRLAAELVHRLGRRSSLAFVRLQSSDLPAGELGAVFREFRRAAGPGSSNPWPRPGSVYLSGIERLAASDQAILEDALRRPGPFRLLVSTDSGDRNGNRDGAFSARLRKRRRTIVFSIPPLRARREDVPALILRFLSEACRRSGVGPFGMPRAAIEAYTAHDWPGNTAELRMCVESAVATAAVSGFTGSVLPESFCPLLDRSQPNPPHLDARPLKEILQGVERTIIESALRRSRGSQKGAARILQLNPTTLHEKMKRHGLLRKSRLGALPGD